MRQKVLKERVLVLRQIIQGMQRVARDSIHLTNIIPLTLH